MLDRHITPFIQRAISGVARAAVNVGLKADHITLIAFGLGLFAMISIAFHAYSMAAILLLASRICDALDGAVARLTQPTDAGGFLDITLDFLFYAGIVLAFAVADPLARALPAAVLLAAFIGTGSSFLAFAALAAKRGITSMAYPGKSFYFLGGLTEGTETLIAFIAMCIWPEWFAEIAYGFAALCATTITTRIVAGYFTLKK
ncbi:MAG: CDP-alcohol phosphatidyltransferase family protein [Brachymonas sp.]|nr:CDP-alcohol phosphatidyltransferase family protein [Brachymonas sp.]